MNTRYDDTKFIDDSGEEYFLFGLYPEWVWKHLIVRNDMKDLFSFAWATYKVGCPYGPCEKDTVISSMKAMHGLSQEAAEYVADKVYPFRDRPKEEFQAWFESL